MSGKVGFFVFIGDGVWIFLKSLMMLCLLLSSVMGGIGLFTLLPLLALTIRQASDPGSAIDALQAENPFEQALLRGLESIGLETLAREGLDLEPAAQAAAKRSVGTVG